jgi:RND family efflux transporter MFP subunit
LDGNEIRGYFTGAGCPEPGAAKAQKKSDPKALNPRAKAADANNNGVIERDEAGGPLLANFGTIDKDKSGTLDGLEIRNFFMQRNARARAGGEQPQAAPRPVPPVVLDKVVRQAIGETFPVIGRLVSRQSGVIAAEVVGAVSDMKVDVGDRVEKGAVIAVIDDRRLKAERDKWAATVEQRKAMIETAKANLKKTVQEERRIRELKTLASSAFSRSQYENVLQDVAARRSTLSERKAQLKEAQVSLRRTEIDLADTRVRAPFGGVILQKHIDVGTYLKVGDRIVTLLNDKAIEVEAEVPTDQILGLKPGVKVTVVLDDQTRHPARLRAIVPQENLRTRTRAVRFVADFKATRKKLALDQSVTVRVPLESAQAVTVHKDAIVRRGANAVVFIVVNSRASARQVELGRGVGSRFVVRSGLQPGDMVVIRGNERLGGGGPVKVLKAPVVVKPTVNGSAPRG